MLSAFVLGSALLASFDSSPGDIQRVQPDMAAYEAARGSGWA